MAFFDKEVDGSRLAVRRCSIRLPRFERFEFLSLNLVGRLFFVMKMSFKLDAAKTFSRALFNVEFICLFGQRYKI